MESPIATRIEATIEELERDRDQIDWAIKSLRETIAELTNGRAKEETEQSALMRDRILGALDGKMQRPSQIAETLEAEEDEVQQELDVLFDEGLVNRRERGWYELVTNEAEVAETA